MLQNVYFVSTYNCKSYETSFLLYDKEASKKKKNLTINDIFLIN